MGARFSAAMLTLFSRYWTGLKRRRADPGDEPLETEQADCRGKSRRAKAQDIRVRQQQAGGECARNHCGDAAAWPLMGVAGYWTRWLRSVYTLDVAGSAPVRLEIRCHEIMTFLRYFLFIVAGALVSSLLGGVFACVVAFISPDFVKGLFSPAAGANLPRYATAVGM